MRPSICRRPGVSVRITSNRHRCARPFGPPSTILELKRTDGHRALLAIAWKQLLRHTDQDYVGWVGSHLVDLCSAVHYYNLDPSSHARENCASTVGVHDVGSRSRIVWVQEGAIVVDR